MKLLEQLKRQKKLYASCPSCEEDFPLWRARLFDATRRLPEYASTYLSEQAVLVKNGRSELAQRKSSTKLRARVAAESTGIGKIVERIAPSLPGFPVRSADCRSLFDPIDYIVFQGLSNKGLVEAIQFVDVKSGGARLSPIQQEIRKVVESGKVRLLIAPRPDEGAT